MIQPDVQEVASVFRGELGWMFGPYPHLIPEQGWPSVGILDALCRGLRGRDDWTEGERLFVSGATAHLAELVHSCWTMFAADVRVEHGENGIICTAKGRDGSVYRLPLERAFIQTLQEPATLRRAPAGLPLPPADGGHLLELFGLSACLAISPLGEGPWAELEVDQLEHHVEAVAPYLADSCARHYARLYPDEPLGGKADLYARLIWPLTLCDGFEAYCEAGANTLAYLDGALALIRGALPALRNLARFPSATVRGAALTCLVLDERIPVSGELMEIAADHFGDRAPLYRAAAIRLAAARGRNIDWLNGAANGPARFRFERQLALLPLVHLPFEMAVASKNRELVMALVEMAAEEAAGMLDARLGTSQRPAELLFQRAMLANHLGDSERADALFAEILRLYPDRLDAEFYLQAGTTALALGRLEDAITRLERARAMGGRRRRVARALGHAYARAGRRQEASRMYADAIARGYLPADALVSRAELHREMGSQEQYSRDLAAAAALHPFNRRVVERVMAGYVET